MKNNEFKKMLIILIPIVIGLALLLINAPFFKNMFASKVTNINGEPTTEFNMEEIAVYKDIDYRIVSIEYGDSIQGYKPMDEDNTYFALTFEVENKSKNRYEMNFECILKTDEVTSEEITTSIIGEDFPDYLEVDAKDSVTYLWEIGKEDVAQTYWCLINGTDIEFTFDLTTD